MLTLSASQISTYRDECKRKWGFKSIAKIPQEQHPSAILGTEVDNEQLQPYLRDGRGFDYTRDSGYIAASALAFLPRPQTFGLEVQKHFTFRSLLNRDELAYQGYKDLWMPNGGMPLPEGYVSDAAAVCDFKTTGNLKWQKTPKQLETDVQAMMYATNAMVVTGARVVDLVWIYMQTKGTRKAKRSHLRVDGKHVLAQFRDIDAVGVEMAKARRDIESQGTDLEALVMQLPPNPDACEGYGGCPYRSRCNLSPAAFNTPLPELETIDMSDTATLLAELKAKRAAAKGLAPVVEAVGGKTGYELSPQQTDGQAAADKGVEAVGINPPEKDLPPAPPVGVVANPPPSTLEEPGKKRGRPAGSKNAPKDPVGADAAAYTGSPPAPDATVPAADEASRHQRIGALVIELASLLGIAS